MPRLNIIGTCSPTGHFDHSEDETKEILKDIQSKTPDILFIGISAPKCVTWVFRHQDQMRPCVVFPVGYSFDVLAGVVPECPDWMFRLGFEWLHRLVQDPLRLWRRYLLGAPEFITYLIKEQLKGQRPVRRIDTNKKHSAYDQAE
jgi:N-acetylglucosaminyldiphosphoundecaprenol N-acetyl-beta-D-mannosaminyltransferase